MSTCRSLIVAPLAMALLWLPARAQAPIQVVTPVPADELRRIEDSTADLRELATAPDDNVPQSLLARADGIVVIPSLVKGGFILGAKHGRGILSARLPNGEWSLPVFVTMTGGSIGWQIGLQSVDLALLIMNPTGVTSLLEDKFTLGGTASVAAGPVGRSAEAATDAQLNSQILAYSRAKGLFAGATLEGSALHPDKNANRAFYGPAVDVRALLNTSGVTPAMPEAVSEWQTLLASFREPTGQARGRSESR